MESGAINIALDAQMIADIKALVQAIEPVRAIGGIVEPVNARKAVAGTAAGR